MAHNAASGAGLDCSGTLASSGYDLIQSVDGCTLVGSAEGQVIGQSSWLNPLADNGGPTWTHALLFVSPAIEAGSCTDIDGIPVLFDQRDVSRLQINACDIGAYEAPIVEIERIYLPLIKS